MRAVIQRVSQASLKINSKIHAEMGWGLVVLLGIEDADNSEDIQWLVKKISQMRIFSDDEGKMNKSIIDIQGEMLIVSQFTLHASTKKGNRPSFIKAAKPEVAIPLYERFIAEAQQFCTCKTGVFGADMKIALVNDGPVTITLDSKQRE
jgi:D-tyrosyl-tRNA(Tyr) deacylase